MNDRVEHWQVLKPAVVDAGGVIAAQHWLAAGAGASMLHAGGNAIDAAVATAFALGVVEPWMCGIGGSGYMVAWLANERRAVVLDFQGMLPAGIRADDYPLDPQSPGGLMGFPGVRDQRNVEGPLSILVPGAVAGLAHASARFGRLGLDRAMAPAIALAERGLPVDWHTTLMIALEARKLARDPAARAWLLPDGLPPAPEQNLANPALLATYRAIAEDGPETVYGGRVGASMAAELAAGGARITLDDFRDYAVAEFEASAFAHRGHDVYTAGPTSGGPRLTDALAHLARHLDPTQGLGPHAWATYAEALDLAFRRHGERLGRPRPETGCTSHLSVADAQGNMVALTYTLLNRFGSGVVLPGTGVLMNNAVAYFDPRPDLPTSMLGRRKINASNMCPTVVARAGAARFAIGASGANHIVPCTFQIASFMLDLGLDLEAALHAPRLDASDRGSVRVDPRVGPAALAALGRRFDLEIAQRLVFPKLFGSPAGVAREPRTGLCTGLADVASPTAAAVASAPFVPPGAAASPHARA